MLAVSAQLPRPCRLAVIAGVLLATFATLAPAEIYQWKDENGKTVFSERPPADGKASVVKPKTGKANSNAQEKLRQDRERIVPTAPEKDSAKNEEQALTPEQEEQKARACEQAQQALALLEQNNRPRYETADGKVAHMSAEMQAERVADAQDKVGKYCN